MGVNDIARSDLNILAWHGGVTEEYFKYSPTQSILQQIYSEKIVNEKSLGQIGFQDSIPMITSGKYVAFNNFKLYSSFKEFPCEVEYLKSPELK